MGKQSTAPAATRALTQDELDAIAGGQQIITHEFPGTHSSAPVLGPPKSIAAGEINENQTDDNLPD